MTQVRAQRHPALARLVVTALACLLAFAVTLITWTVAEALGWTTLAKGIAYMFPVSTAWTATALTQQLIGRGD